jgi:ferredoxin
MEITVHEDRCMSAAQCSMFAPSVFGQKETGGVVLLQQHPGEELQDDVTEAVIACPARAIEVE